MEHLAAGPGTGDTAPGTRCGACHARLPRDAAWCSLCHAPVPSAAPPQALPVPLPVLPASPLPVPPAAISADPPAPAQEADVREEVEERDERVEQLLAQLAATRPARAGRLHSVLVATLGAAALTAGLLAVMTVLGPLVQGL